jgi:hypothetical protein
MQKSRRRRNTRRRRITRRRRRICNGGAKSDDCDKLKNSRCVVKCEPEEKPPKKYPKPRKLRIYEMRRVVDPHNSKILNIQLNEHFPTTEELKKMHLATDDPEKEEDKMHIRNTRVNSRMNYDEIDEGLFKPFRERSRVKPYTEIYTSTDKWVPRAAAAP